MKLRFSLRTLLVLVTCAVALCWWRDGPRRTAHRFVDAIEAGQFDAADAMYAGVRSEMLADFIKRDERNRITANVRPQSAGEWLRGQCLVAVDFRDFGGLGGNFALHMVASGDGIQPAGQDVIWATRAKFINPPERSLIR